MKNNIKGRQISTDDLPKYTVEDWKSWEGKWELIEGIPYAVSPMPTIKHQNINGRLYRQFASLLDHCPDCEVFLPINLRISDNSIIHPDLTIVCNGNQDDVYVTTTPQLVVEIISKSSRKQDTKTKPKIFSNLGTRYYVLIDPKKELVQVFELKKEKYELQLETRGGNYEFELDDCTATFDFSKIW
ncbi:MAG: Uma2 family endonuclease [Saprospiraceae bacterium]